MNELAPILLFTYKRIAILKKTVTALQKNSLASKSELFIFSDDAKSEKEAAAVRLVRAYIKTVDGFKKVTIINAAVNKGLANSIIDGVTKIIDGYGKVIVVEDDLATSTNFLAYMNDCLNFYKSNNDIFSITGFSMPVTGVPHQDVYFTKRVSSWGWATWNDRWTNIDWSVKDYNLFLVDKAERARFNKMGSDLCSMLHKQMVGRLNSWWIRYSYHQFKHDLYSVHPVISKVQNLGLSDDDATNTNGVSKRFNTRLDHSGKQSFSFPSNVELDEKIIKQFIKPYSIPVRIRYKLSNLGLSFLKKFYHMPIYLIIYGQLENLLQTNLN